MRTLISATAFATTRFTNVMSGISITQMDTIHQLFISPFLRFPVLPKFMISLFFLDIENHKPSLILSYWANS